MEKFKGQDNDTLKELCSEKKMRNYDCTAQSHKQIPISQSNSRY